MKKLSIAILSMLMILMLVVNWLFPYSPISFGKTFTYDPDNIVIDQYLDSLRDFKKLYGKHREDGDLTTDRMQYMLGFYESPRLTTKKAMKISQQDLSIILFDLNEVTDTLMELAFSEAYDPETRMYLKQTLESCIQLEKEIEDFTYSTFDSSQTIKRRMNNLFGSLRFHFELLATFYKNYKDIIG